MKSTCIIIEDEPLAAEKLSQFIQKIDHLKLLEVYENPLLAIDALNKGDVDLLFLDINLKELNGIQFLESVRFNGKVIITTAYVEYALKGYELEVIDYLLKPFTFGRFLSAVMKFQQQSKHATNKDFVFIKTENRHEKIALDDILYIKGMGDYRQVVCTERSIMTLQTFKELEELLPKTLILRVHKSYMVAVKAIQSIKNDRIHLKDKIIPVSDSYKGQLTELLFE